MNFTFNLKKNINTLINYSQDMMQNNITRTTFLGYSRIEEAYDVSKKKVTTSTDNKKTLSLCPLCQQYSSGIEYHFSLKNLK